MRIRDHRSYCNVRLDEKLDLVALLDTGSPCNIAEDSLLEPILTKKLDYKEHTYSPWLGRLSIESVRLKCLRLGPSILKSPNFDVFPPAEPPLAAESITLGHDFLSRFKAVIFDYPR